MYLYVLYFSTYTSTQYSYLYYRLPGSPQVVLSLYKYCIAHARITSGHIEAHSIFYSILLQTCRDLSRSFILFKCIALRLPGSPQVNVYSAGLTKEYYISAHRSTQYSYLYFRLLHACRDHPRSIIFF